MRIRKIMETFFGSRQSAETGRRFAEWLAHPTDAERKEEILLERWNEPSGSVDSETHERSWRALRRRMYPAGISPLRRFWRTAAAVAAMLLPSAVLLNLWLAERHADRTETIVSSLPALVEFAVPNGEIREMILPDSTSIVLNGGSVVIYPEQFCGRNREVYLSGKAIFRVTHDSEHPFIVKTAHLRTEVLGTVFCLDSYADDTSATVTLCEGSVRVSDDRAADRGYVLTSGEQLRYDIRSGIFSRRNVPLDDIVAWETGCLVFRRQNLHQIICALERRYGIKVYMGSDRHERALLTLRIPSDFTAEEAFGLIAKLIPEMRYRVDNAKRNIYLD